MQRIRGLVSIAVVGLMASLAWAAFEVTPAVQKEIDRHVEVVKGWAANPVVVKAVVAQNQKGPISGMDNAKWKTVRRSDELVKGFQANEAGKFLKEKAAEGNEFYPEAFLNAAQGEKVAFIEKTTSYIHKGAAKFDVPYGNGKSWQGQPEFDESSQTHQIQVSVPVLSEGKAVGVLVVGINLSKLEKMVKK
ncbi:MAG TPA: hypothetical protein VLH58_05540 [Candidatus Methylomirabilis sp.]|nr:hypothetical protein [Candidatus Methylomirabilis sp.]HSB79865.1 hypothetical protein [Candidatus Methylomirabilis sp.]HSC70794.1 hypothetical protein [Candidatus Methylomirabilis sp.]